MPRWRKLARVIKDNNGKTLQSHDEAKRYVLAKLCTRKGYPSWERAAELLLDKGATAEQVTRQIEFALLHDAALDVVFTRRQRSE